MARQQPAARSFTYRPLLTLAALSLLLGAQCWRVMLSTLVWHYGSTLGLNQWLVLLFAYAPPVLALGAPLLARRLQPGQIIWVAGAGLILCRLIVQISTTTTVVFWAALLGTTCFLSLLLLLVGHARAGQTTGWPAFALGFVLGLALDTALRGLTGTLELSWMPGPWPLLLLVALLAAVAVELRRLTRQELVFSGAGFRASLPLAGLGLLLFLHWQLLQNQGWLATVAGWSPGAALTWITLGNAGALLLAALTLGHGHRSSRAGWTLLAGAVLTVGLALATVPGRAAAPGYMAALLAGGPLLAVLGGQEPVRPRSGRTVPGTLAVGGGLLLFSTLLLLYYFSLIVPLLPFSRLLLLPLAGAGLAICAVAAARRASPAAAPHLPSRAVMGTSLLFVLAPAALLLIGSLQRPVAAQGNGFPVRVMTYNIRAAYGMAGRQDVEAVARVVEEAGAGVIAVQELSRGWFVNGSADLLALLSRRLGMPYMVMGPATDPVAGNAILSRYPILDSGYGDLPLAGALVGRGYVWAELDLGSGATLSVVTTHLDADRSEIRLGQLEALLAAWPARPRTILLGDMNAEPRSREIEMVLKAGYADAAPGSGPAWTHPDHEQRIDWIFHSTDLVAGDVAVIESRASDHLPVVATIDRR
jgi:endonuclease/exonuclease/phosphatase family metal-dependent hydrolase